MKDWKQRTPLKWCQGKETNTHLCACILYIYRVNSKEMNTRKGGGRQRKYVVHKNQSLGT